MRLIARRQAGLAMLDALIAVVVLAVGVLAFASVQANVMVSQRAAKLRQYALVLAEDLLDSARANRAGLADYQYDGSAPAAVACGDAVASPCTPSQMAERDVGDWAARLAALGFDGAATSVDTVVAGDTAEITIVIGWPAGDGSESQVSVSAEVTR